MADVLPEQGKTRFDFWCPRDREFDLDVLGIVGDMPVLLCPTCHRPMERYYGNTRDLIVNYGERSTHDQFEQFRFRNLNTGD